MIQLDKDKVVIDNQESIEKLKNQFSNDRCIVLRQFLSESLKDLINLHLSQAIYNMNTHPQKGNSFIIAKEFVVEHENLLNPLFHLLLNRTECIAIIKRITGLDSIQSCTGRIYKFVDSDGCFDNWHDDINQEEGKLLGFSINLSEGIYGGGNFNIRNKKTKQVYRTIKHNTWGDGHFFKLDRTLEHKVDKVKGDVPRIAYAGWFLSKGKLKDYFSPDKEL